MINLNDFLKLFESKNFLKIIILFMYKYAT